MKAPNSSLIFAGFTVFASVLALGAFVFASPILPIWYSLPIPEQQLDQKIWILLFPLVILGIGIMHTVFLKRVRGIDTNLQPIYLYASLIPIGLLCVALLRILIITL